jgi:Mg-chelatase subunit ChlD
MKKTKQKTTNVFIVLDESGSMETAVRATIGAFNDQLEGTRSQKSVAATMSLVTFANEPKIVHWKTNPDRVGLLTAQVYRPRGGTALYDAIGLVLATDDADGTDQADTNLVVIITDGEENASRIFDHAAIAKLIDARKLRDNPWTFSYIGANHDVEKVARVLNIPISNTMMYASNDAGTRSMSSTLLARSNSYFAAAAGGAPVAGSFFAEEEEVTTVAP